jgi:acetoin utilization deacetylase AcuC-like enzyme
MHNMHLTGNALDEVCFTVLLQAIPEDPDGEFKDDPEAGSVADGPRMIDVGIGGPGFQVAKWRRAWRDKVLPALVNFNPDLILISAGFDAHRKDDINFK